MLKQTIFIFLIMISTEASASKNALTLCSYLERGNQGGGEYDVESLHLSEEDWTNKTIILPQHYAIKVYYLSQEGNKRTLIKNVYFGKQMETKEPFSSEQLTKHRKNIEKAYASYDVKKRPELKIPGLIYVQQHVSVVDKKISNEDRPCATECTKLVAQKSCPRNP